jgi:uncharacterized protein (TIGR03435 family)
MLRNLLIERFGIKWHYEDRIVSAYTLVPGKQMMKKADPSHRSGCRESRTIADDPRDSNPRLNRLVTCQNVTMAQFASLLQGLAPDYLATSVADATGLDGACLSWSSIACRRSQRKTEGTRWNLHGRLGHFNRIRFALLGEAGIRGWRKTARPLPDHGPVGLL